MLCIVGYHPHGAEGEARADSKERVTRRVDIRKETEGLLTPAVPLLRPVPIYKTLCPGRFVPSYFHP